MCHQRAKTPSVWFWTKAGTLRAGFSRAFGTGRASAKGKRLNQDGMVSCMEGRALKVSNQLARFGWLSRHPQSAKRKSR